MFRLILTLLLLPSVCFGWGIFPLHHGQAVSDGSPVCTTPQEGNELNEGFVGVGYELTGWTETIGTNGTVDEDYSLTGTPPTGSCSEGLLTSVTPGSTATYIEKTLPTTITPSTVIDFYFEFKVNSYTLAEYGYFDFIRLAPNIFDNTNYVRMQTESSVLRIRAYGATSTPYQTISEDEWISMQIHIDGSSSYLVINGGSQIPFEAHATNASQVMFVGGPRNVASTEGYSIEWGRIWVNLP